MGRAGTMGQLIMDFTGPVLGWAWSTYMGSGWSGPLVGEPVANTGGHR